MKKIFIPFSLLMMAILPVFAQNSHWEYQNFNPTSAVTVVHSNRKAYLFQANTNQIYVSVIDPLTMLTVNDDYGSLLPATLSLQGAYEDFNGDIVIYGSYNNYPAVALYDPGAHIIKHYAVDTQHSGSRFIDGCCGYSIYGNMINMLVMEYDGIIVAVDWTSIGLNPSGTIVNLRTLEAGKYDRITDVAWDSYNSCFATAGHQYSGLNPQLFLMGFQYDNSNNIFLCSPPFSWDLHNPTNFGYAEYRTNLEILNNTDIVVGVSVRDQNGDDWFWLSNIGYYSIVNNSSIFLFPVPKLFMSDMKFDKSQAMLTILGKSNLCNVNYIAQVNPFMLSGMTTAPITGSTTLFTCYYNQIPFYSNDLFLQKLELNPYSCNHILATGTYNSNEAYITETYDISQSICDYPMNPKEQNAYTNTCSVSYQQDYVNAQVFNFNVQLWPQQSLTSMCSCLDNRPCGLKKMDSPKNMVVTKGKNINVVDNGILVFEGFSSEVDYMVYDALGRIIMDGTTYNGTLNLHLYNTGFYIITAKDQHGNALTRKFIYTREQ